MKTLIAMLPILSFKPVFKSVLWGGRRIAEFKGIEPVGDTVGESWELSPMPGHESVVAEGPMAGQTLPELCRAHGAALLGRHVVENWGTDFPLLVKFIDSNDDLSVQVHPDDELARRRHGSLGKTEMWYSLAPQPGAYLYSGFTRRIDEDTFREMIADNTVVDVLARFDVKPGDVFFLPAGRVHAIGRGNLVAEIQEASDITYRIYDYDRRDAQGNPRELHVEQAVGAIDFEANAVRTAGVLNVSPEAGKCLPVASCRYFTTEVLGIDGNEYTLQLPKDESFTILIGTSGSLSVADSEGRETALPQGRTLLVPAEMPFCRISGHGAALVVRIDRMPDLD